MTETLDNPAYWLQHAKDAREMAKHIADPEMRAILEEIAKSYERISERAGIALPGLNDE